MSHTLLSICTPFHQRSTNSQITRHFAPRNGIESMLDHELPANLQVSQEGGASGSEDRDSTGRIK